MTVPQTPVSINGDRCRRRFAGLACLVLLLSRALGTAAAATPPPLILVSFDGYRADYIARGHSPSLAALGAEGVRARALHPVFPTITYPNHYTIVTGLYPDHHGIVNNTMHDPVLGEFSIANQANNLDRRWWDAAEPLWITAEKHGIRSASIFWPGSQAPIRGARPADWQLFDPAVPAQSRVDRVLGWLDRPIQQRPGFVSLYFEQVDSAGHRFGPDSEQVSSALATVDSALAQLIGGLRKRGLYERVNLVVVSDHGMTASSPQRIVLLDSFLNPAHVRLVSSPVVTGIDPVPGFESEVEPVLLAPHDHMKCWRKSDLPPAFHYGANPRIPRFVCLPQSGWMVSTTQAEAKRPYPLLGEHGYDPDEPDMQALFVAHGPGFKRHRVVERVDTIDVYALLAHLLRLDPVGRDGSLQALRELLSGP